MVLHVLWKWLKSLNNYIERKKIREESKIYLFCSVFSENNAFCVCFVFLVKSFKSKDKVDVRPKADTQTIYYYFGFPLIFNRKLSWGPNASPSATDWVEIDMNGSDTLRQTETVTAKERWDEMRLFSGCLEMILKLNWFQSFESFQWFKSFKLFKDSVALILEQFGTLWMDGLYPGRVGWEP